MRTPQVALFFQKIQILTNGDFRNAGSFSEIDYAYASLIDHHLQNDLLSGIHSIHLKGKGENDVVTLPTGLLVEWILMRYQCRSQPAVQT
ncbi:Uncharacterised protein [Enterobacter cloacae]|nr:Uncharacterised protein [Enterobacter cloacae]